MNKVILLAGVILVLVVGYVAAGPYVTIYSIKTGIVEGDTERLSENIDFPALRRNLKEQLNVVMMGSAIGELMEIEESMKDNLLAALATSLGTALATTMVDGLVDTFITPGGLAIIMQGISPSQNDSAESATPLKKEDLFRNARFAYVSMNKFSIWVPNDEGDGIRFILQRDGLSWKLVNFIIPIDEIF